VLNVAKKITAIDSATNSIGGQTLVFCRRRNTAAGETKMSMTSSQNDVFGAAVIGVLVDSVIGRGKERRRPR
jgi:hypothetical protein